jgi:hypothetical protein
MYVSITMIAAMTFNVRAIIVVITTITVRMTTATTTTTMVVAAMTHHSTTTTDVNMTIDATSTIVATTTTHVRMTGVATTTTANKTTTLTGIIAETPSNVPTITPKGIIVITKILVVMTTQTGEIIRLTIAVSIVFATTTTTVSVRETTTPIGEVVENPHRVTMTVPQGTILKETIVANRISPTGATVILTVVSTTTPSTKTNVRHHGQPYAPPTILDYSRVAIRVSPNRWRQSPAQRKLLASAHHLHKRVPFRASDKLPHQGHRNGLHTYARSPVTRITIPNHNESSKRFQGKFGFPTHSPWILQTS